MPFMNRLPVTALDGKWAPTGPTGPARATSPAETQGKWMNMDETWKNVNEQVMNKWMNMNEYETRKLILQSRRNS